MRVAIAVALLGPIALTFAPLSASVAQAPQLPSAQAVRVSQAPRIDAQLTESVWSTGPASGSFTQREPEEGQPAQEQTEVRFAFDDDALYVGARMFSKDPSQIRALVTRRDNETTSEMFCISMDTYRDRRTAYSFCITPAAVRLEFYHATDNVDDGDEDWNPVWESTARIDSAGWTAEMRIPFSQLRFRPAPTQEWGLNMIRRVPAREEDDYWILVRRTETGWSSRMGALTGISGIKPSRQIEALPYVAGESRAAAKFDAGDPFNKQYTNRARVGGDLKVGLGSNLTLDLTVNPDFGQVEADPAVVNLSAYETFFSERRPFFLEGSELLSQRNLFYSRRIGAPPPGSASGDYVERLANSTILGAGKLTGQLRPGFSVAALAAVTDRETARTFDSLGAPQFGRTVVAPRTAYAVASTRALFGRDQSTIGGTLTAVHRDLHAGDALSALLPQSAYSGFVEGRLRWARGKYDFNSYLAMTTVRGDSTAMIRQQRSSRRYFQRPDASYVEVDSSLRVLNGAEFVAGHSKLAGAHWLWDIDYAQTSPGYEVNDAGRSGAVDNRRVFAQVRWRQTKPSSLYRRWEVGTGAQRVWNFGGLQRNAEHTGRFRITLPNFMRVNADASYSLPALDDRLTRGGPAMGTAGSHGWSLEVEGREGARNNWSVGVDHGVDDFGGWEQNVQFDFKFQPSDRLEVTFNPEWNRGANPRQFVQTVATASTATYNKRYVFGRVALSEIAAPTRFNFTFTPNLTLETVLQPFAASGRFSGLGELPAPRSHDLRVYGTSSTTITTNPDGSYTVDDGAESFDIDNQDFNERSMRSNAVLRWEWRPGSTLFLVWQQNRERERPLANARPTDLSETFGAKADNFFAVKISYWLPVR